MTGAPRRARSKAWRSARRYPCAPSLDRGIQDVDRPAPIDGVEVAAPRRPELRCPGHVHDSAAAADRPGDAGRLANIARDCFNAALRQRVPARPRQIENTNCFALRDQLLHQPAAQKPRPAGDQDGCVHERCFRSHGVAET
jgi:hypothetical protein